MEQIEEKKSCIQKINILQIFRIGFVEKSENFLFENQDYAKF